MRKRYFGALVLLLTGCASYNASTLSMLSVENAIQSEKSSEVLVAAKTFTREESKTFLGRDVIAEGFIPVQLTIRNNSGDPMYLNPSNFNIPVCSPNVVASKVHTSTGGRVAAWGVGSMLFFPLIVPAIVDGFKSANANQALDADYANKSLRECTIQPRSLFNCVAFIPKQYATQTLEMYLVNQNTNEKVAFSAIVL